MNPSLQLHRSLTLWAGLITILFTLSAWSDSRSHISVINAGRGIATSLYNGLLISWYPNRNDLWATYRTSTSPKEIHSKWRLDFFPQPAFVPYTPDLKHQIRDPNSPKDVMQIRVKSEGLRSWELFLPYWLILLPIILTWTALLFLRARRRRRANLLQIP